MYVEFDRDTCIGMYQCVEEWGAFQRNRDEGKADLEGADAVGDDVYRLAVPEDAEIDAKYATRACPVDAITLYDDDGTQLLP